MSRVLVWLFLAASTPVFADGGAILLHKQSPPFVVTVFGSPTPPRVGAIDLSILVQSSETLAPVLDADVRVDLVRNGSQEHVRAARSQARNKLLYATSVDLDDPGEWRYSVSIETAKSEPAVVSGSISVGAEQPKLAAYWPYLMLPFLSLAILALHQWLRFRKVIFANR
jgi:hypothetical protein